MDVIALKLGTFLTVDLLQTSEHIPTDRFLPTWTRETRTSANATAGNEGRIIRTSSFNCVLKNEIHPATLICDKGEFLKRNLFDLIGPNSPNRQCEQQPLTLDFEFIPNVVRTSR